MHAAGKCLQRLDLSDNPMTGDVAQALAVMLQQQPRLRALNLNDTSLEDAGVSTIAQALADSGTPAHTHAHTQTPFLLLHKDSFQASVSPSGRSNLRLKA